MTLLLLFWQTLDERSLPFCSYQVFVVLLRFAVTLFIANKSDLKTDSAQWFL